MNAATTETANCPRCHGTGSGLYNVISLESTCELCLGTGVVPPAQVPEAQAHTVDAES